MAESLQHAKLTNLIIEYIKTTHAGNAGLSILDDRSHIIGAEKPPRIGGFVPDVFAFDTPKTFTLIGEAKTARDLETERSQLQLCAYYEYLSRCVNATLVLSTEWNTLATSKAVMRCVQRQYPTARVEIILLNDMMGKPMRLPEHAC